MFKKIFIDLCNKNNESPSSVCRKINITPATFSCWTDESVPRRATLQRIADYFGVTVDYLLGNEEREIESNATILSTERVHMIPIYESVSAGFGATADNFIVGHMPLYVPNAHEVSETLCIKVKGDSMSPNISDGDFIQVHKQDSVDSGNVAVVLVDGEDALVKKVVYGPDFIELHSFNPEYPTTRFENADMMRVRIIGVVRKVIKAVEKKALSDEISDSTINLIRQLNNGELDLLEHMIDFIISQRKKDRPE